MSEFVNGGQQTARREAENFSFVAVVIKAHHDIGERQTRADNENVVGFTYFFGQVGAPRILKILGLFDERLTFRFRMRRRKISERQHDFIRIDDFARIQNHLRPRVVKQNVNRFVVQHVEDGV